MTLSWYQKEIERVQKAIEKTESEHLKRDYSKYLKRLRKKAKALGVVDL